MKITKINLAAALVAGFVSLAGAAETRPDFNPEFPTRTVSSFWGNDSVQPADWPYDIPYDPEHHYWGVYATCSMWCDAYLYACKCSDTPPPCITLPDIVHTGVKVPEGYAPLCRKQAGDWWYTAKARPGFLSVDTGTFDSALQEKLQGMARGYCETYPEFAAVVQPLLRAPGAAVFARFGYVYILGGEDIVRFAGKKTAEGDVAEPGFGEIAAGIAEEILAAAAGKK